MTYSAYPPKLQCNYYTNLPNIPAIIYLLTLVLIKSSKVELLGMRNKNKILIEK